MNEFEQLKVGDEVILRRQFHADAAVKIDRITATQICASHWRFNRDTGRQIGGDRWSKVHLKIATPEGLSAIREIQERVNIIHAAREQELQKLALDQLRRINAIIQEASPCT